MGTRGLRALAFCALLTGGTGLRLAASEPPAQNPAPAATAVPAPAPIVPRQRIETEVITVTRAAAFPSTIVRRPGVFFLQLITRIPDPQLNLTLAPVLPLADPLKLQGIVDLLSLQVRRRSTGLVDLPVGDYQLQSLPAGKTICTITIR